MTTIKRDWPMSKQEWDERMRELERLTGTDFMMMDVHRPVLDEEVKKVNPQAVVDKSIGAIKIVDSDEAGVDTPHTCEAVPGSARCKICFDPMPCEPHANVEQLSIVTSHDISPTTVLAGAHAAGLTEVVVVGMKEDGTEYFASNVSDAAPAMYYLQRGIYKLNKVVDGEYEDENIGPKPSVA